MKKLIASTIIAVGAVVSVNAHAYTQVERAGFCAGNNFMIAEWGKQNNKPDLTRLALQRVEAARPYRAQNPQAFDSWAEIAIKANKTIQQRAEMSKDCIGNGM
jgi:hypothetical protein